MGPLKILDKNLCKKTSNQKKAVGGSLILRIKSNFVSE